MGGTNPGRAHTKKVTSPIAPRHGIDSPGLSVFTRKIVTKFQSEGDFDLLFGDLAELLEGMVPISPWLSEHKIDVLTSIRPTPGSSKTSHNPP